MYQPLRIQFLASRIIAHLLPAVAVAFLCSCACLRKAPPKSELIAEFAAPFGAAAITVTSNPPIAHEPDLVPHLAFAGVNQHGHPAPLWSLKIAPHYRPYGDPLISPDGHWLVLASDKTVLLFDLQKRIVVTEWACPGNVVRLFFDRSSHRLIGVFNSAERPHKSFEEGYATLGFWELPSMEFTSRPLQPDCIPATNAALTHQQDRILILGIDGSIGIFAVTTGQLQLRFDRHMGEDFGSSVTHQLGGIAITHDDKVATSFIGGAHPNGRLRRWQLADGQEIPTGPEGRDDEREGGYLMTYTSDNRFVLTGGTNLGLMLNTAKDGHGIYNYYTSGYYNWDNLTPNVAIKYNAGEKLGVINVRTGQLLFEAVHEAEPPANHPETHWVILSPDGRTIYSAANNGYILAWNFADESAHPPDQLKSGTSWTSVLALNGTRAQTLEISPGPRGLDRVIEWDLVQRTVFGSAPAMPFPRSEYHDPGSGANFRQNRGNFILKGNICTITGREREAKIVETVTGRTLLHLGALGAEPDPTAPADILRIFGRGGVVATASPDGIILTIGSTSGKPLTNWNLDTGRFLETLDGHTAGVTSVQYSPDGCRLITGDSSGKILVRPVQPRTVANEFSSHPFDERTAPKKDRTVSSHAVQDQTTLAADSPVPTWSSWVSLPSAGTFGHVAHTCTNYDGSLLGIVYATGGPYSSGAEGSFTVWQDTKKGEWRQLYTYRLPRAPTRIALSPNGLLLAVSQLNFMGKSDQHGNNLGDVLILDALTGKLRFVLTLVDARDLAFLDDRQLATAGNGTQIWTLPEPQAVHVAEKLNSPKGDLPIL